jgi:mRNA interferase RelE/StbE
MLQEIADRRVRDKIVEKIDSLSEDPEQKGKPLIGEMMGYYSTRAVGQRYRIIYRIEEEKVIVIVVALGIRREGSKTDVYSLARKLLKLGLFEKPEKKAKKPQEKKAKPRGKK